MKLVKAFIHHVRSASVVEALADAGFRNLTLHDVRGMLKPLSAHEVTYSTDVSGLVISEARLSLVVEDQEVDAVTAIISTVARVGPNVSGYIYVSPVEQVIAIGGSQS
ncbi:P-II family nitrogen regulator [Stagnimonas aquatica]|uniref:P-II family nitrogen regulator n=1 Tax=Stagnimonas aquatica TaxID=2689987 RepID=A0A3N0VA94_9GAMM|nr:P-II family nitrogen regulator [Stagnimonas aquatica]ROH89700.1 P-II family nitrogen regulator [Stagnimonas aquatica]